MSHEEVAPFSMPFVNPNLIPSTWISSWTENPLPSNLPETDKNSFKFEPPPVSHANAQSGAPSDYPRGSLATKGQEESTREQRLERVQGGRGQQESVPQGRRLERRPGGRIELGRGPEGRGGEGQATMDDDDDRFSLAIHTNCGSRIANTAMRTNSNGSNYSSNSSSMSNSNPNSGITFNPKPNLNANRTCSDPLYSAKPNPNLHPHSNSLDQNYNPNFNSNSHSNPNASHSMSGGGGSGRGSGKTVVVGVRLRHKMISQRYEISSDGRDLLQHTLTHLVEGGDTICAVAVAVKRPGAAEMSSQKYDESLQLEFTELLKTTIEHGRAKRVLVISKTPFAIRAMDGLISEVLNLNASTLVLGCNRKKLHYRHWKEPGEYCVKKLPTDCRVLIVKNESFIFAESGVLKVESAPNILVGSNSNSNRIFSHENGIERIVSAPGFSPSPSPSPFPNVDSSRGKFMDMLEQEYSLDELSEATDNFSKNVVLGEGGCGTVYLGYLRGQQVAIKKLKGIVGDRNGWAQFLTEIKVVRKVFHKNLVQLKGSSLAGDSCFLVFDFLPNGSLDGKLRDPQQPPLTWAQRFKIAKGAAEGLKYLHEFCVPPIIHRDVKSANILLDEKFEPQVADFGLAKLVPDGQSQFEPFEVTAIMGTEGYVAPEYIRFGEVTEAIDVYSYGVVLLEILSGQKPASQARNPRYITDWAHQHSLRGDYEQIMDPRLNGEYDPVQAEMMAKIALVCTVSIREERPKMADVVRYLEDVETQSRRR